MEDKGFDQWVGRVYGAESNEDLKRKYDAWAADYDRDVESVRYNLPALAAGLFGRYVAPDAGEILDAGCGTGLLGEPLHLLRYQGLVGVDLSPEMLARAKARGVYRELQAMDLGARLDFPDDRFAAAAATGHTSRCGTCRVGADRPAAAATRASTARSDRLSPPRM